jgi:hypothetical protein
VLVRAYFAKVKVKSFQCDISVRVRTVNTAPTSTVPRLNVCCVVLATLSRADKSFQATLPSSLNVVTAFLLGCDGELVVPSPVCVAYSLVARIGRILEGRLNRHVARVTGSMFDRE